MTSLLEDRQLDDLDKRVLAHLVKFGGVAAVGVVVALDAVANHETAEEYPSVLAESR